MRAMEIFGFLVIEVFDMKIFVFLWLKYFRLKYSRDMDRNTRMMKIFLRAWIVIEVFERIPAKVSPSNVSWTSLFCISYVRGGFVIKEMLNFLTGNFLFFPISYFPVKTNHFRALRAPVIRAHKIVHKSLLSSWKISLN